MIFENKYYSTTLLKAQKSLIFQKHMENMEYLHTYIHINL